jgi:hypothetical protein
VLVEIGRLEALLLGQNVLVVSRRNEFNPRPQRVLEAVSARLEIKPGHILET